MTYIITVSSGDETEVELDLNLEDAQRTCGTLFPGCEVKEAPLSDLINRAARATDRLVHILHPE